MAVSFPRLVQHCLGAKIRGTVILTGMAADICVLFTANDAYMRDLHLIVPPDCVTSEQAEQNRLVLALMERVLKAELKPSGKIRFDAKEIRMRQSAT